MNQDVGRVQGVSGGVPSKSATHRTGPALFKRGVVTRHRSATQRAGALFLWVVSVAGAVLWGGGGWTAWSGLNPNLGGAALALVVQLLTSWAQLTASDQRLSVQYLGALVVSSTTTLLGYMPLVSLGLSTWFGVEAWTLWWWASTLTIVVVAIALDVIPEETLFED